MNKLFIIFLFLSSFTFSQTDSSECDKFISQFESQQKWAYDPFEFIPTIIGGIDTIQTLINYPVTKKKENEGKVYVKVYVDTLGNVHCPGIIKGISNDLDQEALRVVSLLKFIPGSNNGKKAIVHLAVPIQFKNRGSNE